MLTVTIELTGRTLDDIKLAIEEAQAGIVEGYYTGANSNDTGSYSFSVSGEETIMHEAWDNGKVICGQVITEDDDNHALATEDNNWVTCEECQRIKDEFDDRVKDNEVPCYIQHPEAPHPYWSEAEGWIVNWDNVTRYDNWELAHMRNTGTIVGSAIGGIVCPIQPGDDGE